MRSTSAPGRARSRSRWRRSSPTCWRSTASPELLEEGRRRGGAFPNVTFVEGDATEPRRPPRHVRPRRLLARAPSRAPPRDGGRLARPRDPVRRARARDRPDRARRSAGRGRARPLRACPRPRAPAAAARHRPARAARGERARRRQRRSSPRRSGTSTGTSTSPTARAKRADARRQLAPPSPTAIVGWYLAVKPLPAA